MAKVLVKICRVSDLSTARLSVAMGADLLGLHVIRTFANRKLRRLRRIVKHLTLYYPKTGAVLLTKSQSVTLISRAIRFTGTNWLQLHRPFSTQQLRRLIRAIETKTGSLPNVIAVVSSQSRLAPSLAARLARLR